MDTEGVSEYGQSTERRGTTQVSGSEDETLLFDLQSARIFIRAQICQENCGSWPRPELLREGGEAREKLRFREHIRSRT